MPACTASFILHRVRSIYGRMTKKIAANILEDLNNEIDRLCSRWHFWFLDLEPGMSFIKTFPYANQSDLQAVVPAEGQWVDRGWLLTKADQLTYPFMRPLFVTPNTPIGVTGATITSDPIVTPSNWISTRILRIRYIKQMTLTGTSRLDMTCMNWSDFMSRGMYSQTSQPIIAAFNTENDVSSIAFGPCPDDVYAMCIGATVLPTPLDRPDSVNELTMYAPLVAIYLGLIVAAKYFGEKTEIDFWKSELYGPAYAQAEDPNMQPGGIVGELWIQTKTKRTQKENYRENYRSSRFATNRSSRTGQPWPTMPGFYSGPGMDGP